MSAFKKRWVKVFSVSFVVLMLLVLAIPLILVCRELTIQEKTRTDLSVLARTVVYYAQKQDLIIMQYEGLRHLASPDVGVLTEFPKSSSGTDYHFELMADSESFMIWTEISIDNKVHKYLVVASANEKTYSYEYFQRLSDDIGQ